MFGQKVSAWLPDLLITVKATTVGRRKPLTIKVSQSFQFAFMSTDCTDRRKIFAKPIAVNKHVQNM